ncbi:hypothetical protein PHLGIDRAFT_501384 [Phlebiopsis gigantea 11061_1 CR5-6]|uniref:Uncharacterized protein n=1 Tax=Phlebiopsis gigantea (strain 11061_1 CR5-6) TaxID=745531 RepID=A0A0C3S0L7_PHLG1|nr:hypothetical protein PHLGIDRAFT_501384 [Phlebiopsis gigantea 11061_1 CR5-6]
MPLLCTNRVICRLASIQTWPTHLIFCFMQGSHILLSPYFDCRGKCSEADEAEKAVEQLVRQVIFTKQAFFSYFSSRVVEKKILFPDIIISEAIMGIYELELSSPGSTTFSTTGLVLVTYHGAREFSIQVDVENSLTNFELMRQTNHPFSRS